jgi:hypothetical protein
VDVGSQGTLREALDPGFPVATAEYTNVPAHTFLEDVVNGVLTKRNAHSHFWRAAVSAVRSYGGRSPQPKAPSPTDTSSRSVVSGGGEATKPPVEIGQTNRRLAQQDDGHRYRALLLSPEFHRIVGSSLHSGISKPSRTDANVGTSPAHANKYRKECVDGQGRGLVKRGH